LAKRPEKRSLGRGRGKSTSPWRKVVGVAKARVTRRTGGSSQNLGQGISPHQGPLVSRATGKSPLRPNLRKNHLGAPSASKIPGKAPEPERLGASVAPAPPSARGAPGYRAGSDAEGSATWRPGPDRRGEPWREMRRVRPQTRARGRAPSPESAKPQRKARSQRENLFRLRELHRGKSSV